MMDVVEVVSKNEVVIADAVVGDFANSVVDDDGCDDVVVDDVVEDVAKEPIGLMMRTVDASRRFPLGDILAAGEMRMMVL